jgi:hypothetical protein
MLQKPTEKMFAFMPFLAFETSQGMTNMQRCLTKAPGPQIRRNTGLSVRSRPSGDAPAAAEFHAVRDFSLHEACPEPRSRDDGLHVRRTLDQYFYRHIDTSQGDLDQVIFRYQDRARREQMAEPLDDKDIKLLMVDQVWLWIWSEDLIITSFPQRWDLPRREKPDLLASILRDLEAENAGSADLGRNVYDLATGILGHC